MANVLVAEYLYSRIGEKTLLRIHDEIADNRKLELATYFATLGLQIDFSDSQSLNASVQGIINSMASDEQKNDMEDVINRKVFGALKIAYYNCIGNQHVESCRHYGLNFDFYTHFTSPIRRYADLLVHRLLTICLASKEPPSLEGLDYGEYVDEISNKSYNARKASKDCVTLFHCLLLREHGAKVYDCLIYDIEGNWSVNIFVRELNLDL